MLYLAVWEVNISDTFEKALNSPVKNKINAINLNIEGISVPSYYLRQTLSLC